MYKEGDKVKLNGESYKIVKSCTLKKYVVCSICQHANTHMPCLKPMDCPEEKYEFDSNVCNLQMQEGCFPKRV